MPVTPTDLSQGFLTSKDHQTLPPTENCFICNKPLSEIGGRRLVAWNGNSILQQTLQKALETNKSQGLTGPTVGVSEVRKKSL